MKDQLKTLGYFFYDVWQHITAHNVARRAAAISYYAIFAIAPTSMLILAMGRFFLPHNLTESSIGELAGTFIHPSTASTIERIFSYMSPEGSSVFLILGVILLFVSALRIFHEIEDALHEMFDPVSNDAQNKTWVTQAMSFVVMIVFGVFGIAFLATQSLLQSFFTLIQDISPQLATILPSASILASILVSFVLLTLLFRFIPRVSYKWGELAFGALITSLLITLGQKLFSYYVGTIGITSALGAAGSIIVFMLWVYYSAVMLLLGISLTYVYIHYIRKGKTS